MPLDQTNQALPPSLGLGEERGGFDQPTLHHATIHQTTPLRVTLDGQHIPAIRAVSCLVTPQPGDTVLVTRIGPTAILLHILTRAQDTGITLAHQTGLTLEAPHLALHGTETLAVRTPTATVETSAFSLHTATASLAARTASAVAGTLRTVAERLEQAATTLLTHAATRTAVITEADTLDAHTVHTAVETALTIQTGATVLTADTDIRMDATRIAMG